MYFMTPNNISSQYDFSVGSYQFYKPIRYVGVMNFTVPSHVESVRMANGIVLNLICFCSFNDSFF